MRILAIESSAKAASCAVWSGGAVEAYAFQNAGLTHSRTLLPMIEDMLRNAGLSIGDIDAVAVAHGPGSFTGVRIGVATAKGLALGASARNGAALPLYGVSTLEAMARGSAVRDGVVLCAMDARRGEVYAAVFEAKGGEFTRLCDDFAAPAGEAVALARSFVGDENGQKMLFFVGDGAELCYNVVAEDARCALTSPQALRQNAVGVAITAERLVREGAAGDAAACVPVYLRVSQAERERLGNA